MSAGIHNFYIEAGTSWSKKITLFDNADNVMNLTGYTGKMEIREKASSPTVTATATVEITNALAGEITISLPANAISAPGDKFSTVKKYAYDLELNGPGGIVIRVLNGDVTVSPEVTR